AILVAARDGRQERVGVLADRLGEVLRRGLAVEGDVGRGHRARGARDRRQRRALTRDEREGRDEERRDAGHAPRYRRSWPGVHVAATRVENAAGEPSLV